ncbi:hypothetical protein FN846DRAFT_893356 [Sphaerosporella brunnea]|uniref:Uncharacterized protein n=1 Tax=Sphaerosporella brunnea TaxID=1250544 RepID=A0A5J5EMV6_9PEZI|nr:hypothetical protein FN846DRAFT_893356 [Sphaerosporella brunnea]
MHTSLYDAAIPTVVRTKWGATDESNAKSEWNLDGRSYGQPRQSWASEPTQPCRCVHQDEAVDGPAARVQCGYTFISDGARQFFARQEAACGRWFEPSQKDDSLAFTYERGGYIMEQEAWTMFWNRDVGTVAGTEQPAYTAMVEQWTPDELFQYLKSLLCQYSALTHEAFNNAEIKGAKFLNKGAT